jgi:hypothetical protein
MLVGECQLSLHKVPRCILIYKFKGISSREGHIGPESVLKMEEEQLLLKWNFTVAKVGFPIPKLELLDSIRHLVT